MSAVLPDTRRLSLSSQPRPQARLIALAPVRWRSWLSALLLALATLGPALAEPPAADPPPYVLTIGVGHDADAGLGLSGTVRAQVETPLAFQVAGRIRARHVDAGQAVKAGQVLFELDPRDLELAVRSAQADQAAAASALATATAELARNQELRTKGFVSAQDLERAALAQREAETRQEAAAARLAQAQNARNYGRLDAPHAGVLIDVTGEAGQVVAAGAPVATLAQAGEREVEVNFPEGLEPPASGRLLTADGSVALRLREVAGSVEPQGRTRRARYRVSEETATALVLGSVVRTRFATGAAGATPLTVPIGAIDERGDGPRIWLVGDGQVQPLAVTVLAIDGEYARITANVAATDRVVAVGTHLLQPGMAVRELTR